MSYDAFRNRDIMLNGKVVKGGFIGKGVEGSGPGLIRGTRNEIPPSPPLVTIVIVPTEIRIGHPTRK